MRVPKPDVPSLDRSAAARATLVSLVTVMVILSGQAAIAEVATGHSQPMPAVDRVPVEPSADGWTTAPTRTASLSKQQMAVPYGGGTVDEVEVQALTNDTHVAVRMTWQDPTNDTSLSAPGNYSDAAAVMLKGGDSPPITMGAAGTPVNIWYWRSAWQYGDDRAEWEGDMYAYPHPDEGTQPGQAAGNPLSQDAHSTFADNYYAKGYGSLSHAPAQPVEARGERTEDGWTVVFVRERSTGGEFDAAFDEHDTMYLAFAVWNGSADEVNGQKSLTFKFTTLDTKSGELGQADPGGGDGAGSAGGSGDADSGGGGSDGGGSSALDPLLFDYLGPVLAAVVVSWLVAYRRMKA